MRRLTITLSDERHAALKQTAARRNVTVGALVDESLERAGIKTSAAAADLVAEARRRSELDEAAALKLATRETRATRRR
jgi:predicted DNA-binding ribbon-helix-helix protein